MEDKDLYFMRIALQQAELAFEKDEVPIGAIIVYEDKIIGKGYNQVETLQDATAHAEMIALTAAFQHMNAKYAMGSTLYVTLEPCIMCAGASHWAKISKLVYAASDPQKGYSQFDLNRKIIHPKIQVVKGILENESLALIKKFFLCKR